MTVYDPSTGYRDERVENIGNNLGNLASWLEAVGEVFGEGFRAGLFCDLGSIDDDLAALERATDALREIAEGEFDDLDPDDGLHQVSARARARAVLEQP